MTSSRKINANRINSKRSTGPKSSLGRFHSSRNARRHGLSIPVFADPELSDEIKALARRIVQSADDPEMYAHAACVAAAQIDLIRIHKAKHEILCRALARPVDVSTHPTEVESASPPGVLVPPEQQDLILNGEALRALLLVARYERRAVSRRKNAIRQLAHARSQLVELNANLAERSQKGQ